MKKRLGMLFFVICLVTAFVVPSFAAEDTRVFDYADLLSEAEEAEVQLWAETFQQEYEMDLAVLTTEDTEGKSVREYGADFYISHDLGVGADYDGVIFVLDMGSREGQIVTCGKAIEIYTDYYIDQMWNDMVGFLSDGAYQEAISTLYTELQQYAEEYAAYLEHPDTYVSEYQQTHPEEEKGSAIGVLLGVAAIVSLGIAGVSIAVMRRSCKTIQPYTDGRAYLKENGYVLTIDRDTFANTHTTMMPIPKDDDTHHSGGSWGGGSSTFSSGGRSFGGGGGKF